MQIFPPPGPDRSDSFFADDRAGLEDPGAALPGRGGPGPKCQAGAPEDLPGPDVGGRPGSTSRAAARQIAENPADPYMTMLGYFNSLRELGGTRRLIEDEVTQPADPVRQTPADRRRRTLRSPIARSSTRSWS